MKTEEKEKTGFCHLLFFLFYEEKQVDMLS